MSLLSELATEKASDKVSAKINRDFADVLTRMEARASSGNTTGIPGDIRAACNNATTLIESQIAQTYQYNYYHEIYEMQDAVGTYYRPRKLSQPQINAYLNHKLGGRTMRETLAGHYRQYAAEMKQIIDNGRRSGISTDEVQQIIRAKTGTVGESGLTYKIQRVLRTESNAAVNAASIAAFKQTGVEEYRYNAILDGKECDHCRDELHGRVFKVKEARVGINLPPTHPNCRCFIEFILGEKALEQMRRKGRKSRHISYRTWLKRYVL